MKQVVYGSLIGLIVIVTIVAVVTVNGKKTRQGDVDNALQSSVENAVETTMNEKVYSISSNEEFIADFTQNLLVQISNDSDIEIQVAKVDYEKGILGVKVIETFTHPNGKEGKNECETTVVFEHDQTDSDYVSVRFLLDDGSLYKEYRIKNGDRVVVPKNPTKEGKTFTGWCLENSSEVITEFGNASEDITYVASFD